VRTCSVWLAASNSPSAAAPRHLMSQLASLSSFTNVLPIIASRNSSQYSSAFTCTAAVPSHALRRRPAVREAVEAKGHGTHVHFSEA